MSQLLSQNIFVLFFIISIGLILGNIKIKGISLGVSAVLFVALVMGHYGFVVPGDFQRIGLVLFIFTIGIQAGPGLFESYRRDGLRLNLLVVILVFSAFVISVLCSKIIKVDSNLAVGLFTGALTSTPGLAAAIESSQSAFASIGYGVAYPFGVLGVILFIKFIPKIFKIDGLQVENEYYNRVKVDFPEVSNKNFIVENVNIDGKTLADLELPKMINVNISRVMHGEEAITPTAQTVLHLGYMIKAVGDKEALEKVKLVIGKETEKEIPLSKNYDVQWIFVTNKKVVNKTLAELNLMEYYQATITRIRRSDIVIVPRSHSRIRFGDRLMVASSRENMKQVAKLLGNNDKHLSATNFLPIALGIVLGMLFGKIEIPFFGGIKISPGVTGGVLIAALILSRIGKTGPVIWSMSEPANRLIRTLGILLFLAAVGTSAGVHLEETVLKYGPELFAVGIFITLLPMFIAAILGYFIFKINFFTLLGVITGGMTSTPGLAATDSVTDCNAPEVAYATVYPVALVCVIVFSRIMLLF